MRPLFTIHAGELLVGEYVERNFRNTNVWIPAKDRGVDLLVTDKKNRRSVSLQVKFSRDFLVSDMPAAFQPTLRACGWWTFDTQKLRASTADYWVLALVGFAHRSSDFIVIPPRDLLRRLPGVYKTKNSRIQTYLWVTTSKKCWETRGLRRSQQSEIAQGKFTDRARDFSKFLNNWLPLKRLDRAR